MSAVQLWGDTELDRVALHTNLDRLKNLLQSLPEEESRVQKVRTLGELVIPGTLESGQANIRLQMDSSQQEWEASLSTIKSTIEALTAKLNQWNEYEICKENCLKWLRDTDTRIHETDLKATLEEKKDQLKKIRDMQGEVRAKKLELDAVTERAHVLNKQTSSRSSQIYELGIRYQQISSKVKELNVRWQNYVTSHQEFDNQISECNHWLDEISSKVSYCSDLSISSQKDLDSKMEVLQDLLIYKENGFAKVFKNILHWILILDQIYIYLHLIISFRFKASSN